MILRNIIKFDMKIIAGKKINFKVDMILYKL